MLDNFKGMRAISNAKGAMYAEVVFVDPHVDANKRYSIDKLCCTIDTDLILNYVELCKDYKTLYLTDNCGLLKAWAVGLGASLYINKRKDIREVLFDYSVRHSKIPPKALWTIETFDLEFRFNGLLTQIVEEYLVTGRLVKIGSMFQADWFSGH